MKTQSTDRDLMPVLHSPLHSNSGLSTQDSGLFTTGQGFVRVEQVGSASVIVRASAASPLKLLTPQSRGGCAWLVASGYGGGLVGGDHLRLKLDVGPNTCTLLTTQASTKIYRSPGRTSRQSLRATVSENATLVVAPDPLVCFKDATFSQQQAFDLTPTSNLVLVDTLGGGRVARGERWAFHRYESRIDISVNQKKTFHDALLLDPIDGALTGPMRLGRFNALATLLVIGPRVQPMADDLLAWINRQPSPHCDDEIIFAASPTVSGVVIRAAAVATESLGRWVRERLAFVPTLLDEDPWRRKW